MLFNSYYFILVFFPCTFAGYFILNALRCYRSAKLFLVAASLYFYSYFKLSYLPIIVVSMFCNYYFGMGILRSSKRQL